MSVAIDPFVQFAALGLIAIVFARALIEKIANYAIYAATLRDYRLLPEALAPLAAAALLAAEAGALALLIWPATRPLGALAAIGLLAIYAGAMALALRAGRSEIECGCGGDGQIVSWPLVARNVALMALAALVALPATPRALNLFDHVQIVCAVLVGWLLLGIAEKAIETHAAILRLRAQSYL